MKSKNRKLFLFLTSMLMVGSIAGATGCGDPDESSSSSSSTTESSSSSSSVENVETYYTVSFNVDGGSAIESVTVLEGETVAKPSTNPTKAGYVFVGWYKNQTYTVPFVFDAMAITADTTIYAKFVQVCEAHQMAERYRRQQQAGSAYLSSAPEANI